ncbi:MAG TPA: hypothetical protein VMK82_04030 [Steroidobacteraceae bacterium]|nr:hypothetical protein [Steroidobacteraceae bacterium]
MAADGAAFGALGAQSGELALHFGHIALGIPQFAGAAVYFNLVLLHPPRHALDAFLEGLEVGLGAGGILRLRSGQGERNAQRGEECGDAAVPE